MQPLDRTVFKSLKNLYGIALSDFERAHPDEPVTMRNIAEIMGNSYSRAFSKSNIQNGFIHTFSTNLIMIVPL